MFEPMPVANPGTLAGMSAELPRTFKLVTVWLLGGLLVFLGVQWQLRQREQPRFTQAAQHIDIRRGPDGHYHWPGSLNGRAVDFLVDTGATGSALSAALARELGLQVQGHVASHTAGGVIEAEQVRADLLLQGGVRAERLPMVALPGLGEQPLLGMDVLGRLRWSQRDGVLRIEAAAAS